MSELWQTATQHRHHRLTQAENLLESSARDQSIHINEPAPIVYLQFKAS